MIAAVYPHGTGEMQELLVNAVVEGVAAGMDWGVLKEVGTVYGKFSVDVMASVG